MAEWRLTDAEEARRSITSAQEKEIAKLYRRVYQGIRKQIQAIPKNGNISSRMRKQYLEKLQSQLDEAYKELRNDVKKTVEDNIEKAAQAVADSTGKFLKDVGLTIEGAYSFVPKDIVTMLSTGQLYQGNWSLSKALWKDVQKHQFDINRIIAEGVAANKSAYDIAKDLEKNGTGARFTPAQTRRLITMPNGWPVLWYPMLINRVLSEYARITHL